MDTAIQQVIKIAFNLRTDRDDQEADVAEPIRSLVGQLLHKEAQHCAEVALVSCYGNLDGGRRLGIAVAAVGDRRSETAF